jgi:hypothetical protein
MRSNQEYVMHSLHRLQAAGRPLTQQQVQHQADVQLNFLFKLFLDKYSYGH